MRGGALRGLYTVLLWLAAPLFWIMLWRRSRREGGHWGILSKERFGTYSGPVIQGAVWVHAVSLGETRAARPLLEALLQAGYRVLLTHTTATAKAESARVFADPIVNGQLLQQWMPYDFPRAMRGFYAAYRPRLGVLIEREVWPNLVVEANRASLPLVLVSARLSQRSAASMHRLRYLMRPAFAGLSAVLAQTSDDATRLERCGATTVEVVGNLKFDVSIPVELEDLGKRWAAQIGRPIVCLASTRDGEEALFVRAVADAVGATAATPSARPEKTAAITTSAMPEALNPAETKLKPLFLLVPRHPQRFDEVARLLQQSGQVFQRRSQWDGRPLASQVQWLLGDSMGEMAAYYAASSVAIIGGSFVDFGGQNLVEASAAGVPVIVGPYTRNFAQAADDAIAAGAAARVADASQAIHLAMQWLDDVGKRGERVQAARRFVQVNRGATERVMRLLGPWL